MIRSTESSPRPVRVASVPAEHVYVRHLSPVDPDDTDARVIRLPDPRHENGQWWPPVMMTAEWVRTHAGDFDVMHVHFGFDALSTSALREFTNALASAGKPLVLTVHDLRNPHHAAPDLHEAQLDVLIPAASALVTLTPGAAAVIGERWTARAQVLPHPHVFDLADIGTPREPREQFRIGIHCKSLRECMDPLPLIRSAVDAAAGMPGARVVVNAHHDIMAPDSGRYATALAPYLVAAAEAGRLDLSVHDFFSDDALRDYLASLDVSVLPYRFGTHSGWAEACYDLGTGVVAPDVGYYHQQVDAFVYRWHGDGSVDVGSFRAALRSAYAARGAYPRATRAARIAQRNIVAAAHHELYRNVLEQR